MRRFLLTFAAMRSMLFLDDIPYTDMSHKSNSMTKNSRKNIKGKRHKSLKVRSNRRKAKMRR